MKKQQRSAAPADPRDLRPIRALRCSDGTPLLPWLRTCSVSSPDDEELVREQRMMAHLIIENCSEQQTVSLLERLPAPVYCSLTALIVRHCCPLDNALLCEVAVLQPQLRALHVPNQRFLEQSTIDQWKQLQVLNVSHCPLVHRVPGSHLQVLYARGNECGIGDAGLRHVRGLQVLYAGNNSKITTVEPFASSLVELEASFACGIGSRGLSEAHKLSKLYAWGNDRIQTVEPFGASLLELDASFDCAMNDEGLRTAVGLRVLDARNNPRIRTTEPFGSTLAVLDASGTCGIDDSGLLFAAGTLRQLRVTGNKRIEEYGGFTSVVLLYKE